MSDPKTEYTQFNDFFIEKLDLILDSGDIVSLLDLYAEINFYQDVFGSPMFCEIEITDALDLYSNLPIKNTENLEIWFNSPGSDVVKKTMRLYSRENVLLKENGKVTYYTLRFVSPETYFNLNIKNSRSYSGKISDIVGAIWSENFSTPITIEETDSEYTLVLPYENPFAHIDFLTKKALRATNNNECNFVFYEDFNGFNFVSLSTMFTQPLRGVFSYDSKLAPPPNESVITGSRVRIQELDFLGLENLIDETSNGLYNGYVNSHDIKNKKISQGLKYSYSEAFDQITHLNSHPLAPAEIYEKSGPLSSYQNRFSGVFPTDVSLKRQSQMNSLLNKRLRFLTAGSSSTNAGDRIKLDFVRQSGVEFDSNFLDKYRSGYYIVSSVKHTINKLNGYTMTVEACTDSYANPLPTVSNFESKVPGV
jgi:hypothetical protein